MSRAAALRKLLANATPGPWTHYPPPHVRIVAPEIPGDIQRTVGLSAHNPNTAFGDRVCEVESESFNDAANAALIAAAPEAMALLLDVAEAAQAAHDAGEIVVTDADTAHEETHLAIPEFAALALRAALARWEGTP